MSARIVPTADLGNLAHLRSRVPETTGDVSPVGWKAWREGRWVEIYGPVDVRGIHIRLSSTCKISVLQRCRCGCGKAFKLVMADGEDDRGACIQHVDPHLDHRALVEARDQEITSDGEPIGTREQIGACVGDRGAYTHGVLRVEEVGLSCDPKTDTIADDRDLNIVDVQNSQFTAPLLRTGREPDAGASLDPSNVTIKHATGSPVKKVSK